MFSGTGTSGVTGIGNSKSFADESYEPYAGKGSTPCVGSPFGDCYLLAQADEIAMPSGTEGADSTTEDEQYVIVGKLLSGDPVEQMDAMIQLVSVAAALSTEKKSIYEIIVSWVMILLRDNPELAEKASEVVSKMVIDGKYPSEDKKRIMKSLAAMYNDSESVDVQKSAILTVYANVAETEKADAFSAGIEGVVDLNEEGHELLSIYIDRFIKHASAKDAIGTNDGIGDGFVDAVGQFTSVEPTKVMRFITDINNSWFQSKDMKVLWDALMVIGGAEGQTEYGTSPDDMPIMKPMTEAVKTEFMGKYEAEEEGQRAETALWVVKHMDKKVSELHVELMEHFITKDTPVVRKDGVLKGLKDVNPDKVDESVFIRLYFKLIDHKDSRTDAIVQGVTDHDLQKRLLKYLISDDAKNLRNHAHEFEVDKKIIGGPIESSPIVEYGIKRENILEVEKICKEGANTDEKKQQCEETIDALYKEYRKRHGWFQLDMVGLPAQTIMGLGNPMERDIHGGELSFGLITAAAASGVRGLVKFFGGYYNDNAWTAGMGAGVAADLGDKVQLRFPIEAAYLQFQGDEDDLKDVAYTLTEETGGGYTGEVISTDVKFMGAQLLIHPEIIFNLKRWRLGGGRTFTLMLGLSAYFGIYAGQTYDEPNAHSFTPDGDISATPGTDGWDVTVHANDAGRLRNGEWIFGYIYGAKLNFGFEFYGFGKK